MATRRGRGEGSVTRRADGRWMARVDLGWQDGKRCRKTLYGRTKREVQDKLREMLHRTDQGLPLLPEQETVGAFLHRWQEFKKGELRPRSYESYEHLVRAHLLPGLERVRLAKLTPLDVSAWFRRHHAQGAGARTIQYSRSVLRVALNQARLRGTADESTRRRLTAELDDVKRRLDTVAPTVRLAKPKTARSRRTIMMPDVVAASLRAHRKRRETVAGECLGFGASASKHRPGCRHESPACGPFPRSS